MAGTWMLYGANGFTGELIAEQASKVGESPILAGRRDDAIAPIAERFGFERRIFSLDSPAQVARNLEGVDAVLHCAGPFIHTSKPMVGGCLESGTHYLDITGEIAVFEACHRAGSRAADAGCVLLPGVGFDVVPSDCLAATLAERLPGATSLELAFSGAGSPSKGTATTMVEGMPHGGAIRRGGRIEIVPLAWKEATIEFRDKPRKAVSIPWGDVSTAYYSTGIGDIVVYMAVPPRVIRGMKLARPFRKLLGKEPVQRFLKNQIQKKVEGPSAERRANGRSQLWGRVRDGERTVEGTLVTPEAYRLTALTAVESVKRVVAGKVQPGAATPSTAFGAGYITEFEGCDLRIGD